MQCKWEPIARDAARDNGIDEWVFVALIRRESGFNPEVPGGIAQIDMRWHDVDAGNPAASLSYAAHLLRSYLDDFGRYDLALAAYNVGGSLVRSIRAVPHNGRTEWYVMNILSDAVTARMDDMRAMCVPLRDTVDTVSSVGVAPDVVPPVDVDQVDAGLMMTLLMAALDR